MTTCITKKAIFQPPFPLLLLSLFLFACQGNSNRETTPPAGKSPSAIRLAELDGSPIDLSALKGKTVFLNFWASWCKPCIREMPSIQKAKQELEKEGVVFLFASNEEVETIRDFGMENSYDFKYVQLQNAEEIGLEALPTTYIINPAGEIVYAESGFRSWNDPESLRLIRNANTIQ